MYALSLFGLPAWLQGGPAPEWAAPILFPLVKSKCYSDSGQRISEKPGHSCWRRILDVSRMPHAYGWRVIGRAVRGLLEATGASHELFNISHARGRLDRLVGAIIASPSPRRLRCGCPMDRCLAAATVDIDQAFEACSGDRVVAAWRRHVGWQRRLLVRQVLWSAVAVRRKSWHLLPRCAGDGFSQRLTW